MLRIAICDEDQKSCGQLEEMIHKEAKAARIQIKTEVFFSGAELYNSLKKDQVFDLIFLDVVLSESNGIKIGRRIRKELQNLNIQIVYISEETGHAMKLFANHPLHFLVKPLDNKKIAECIITCERMQDRFHRCFTYRVNRKTKRIAIKDIIYFESSGKKIKIVTCSGTEIYYDKLKDISNRLKNRGFLRIHKSLLVNYQHIQLAQYDKVLVTGGIALPVSQSQRKKVRETISLLGGEDKSNHD